MGRLVVVSNRVVAPDPGSAAQAGGLAVALKAALRGREGLWFGWSGARVDAFTGEVHRQRYDALEVATIDLAEADFEPYYNSYANGALWPVFHARIDLATYDPDAYDGYRKVNRQFAETLAAILAPDDLVWVHDYHLIPLAQELRRLGARNRIGFFLHIPFPPAQLFCTLPRHRDLAEALFSYDLVGMQTPDCVAEFEDYVLREAGGRRDGQRLRAFGLATRAAAYPIGLDTEDFVALSRSAPAVKAYDRMAARGVFRQLIVGADRMDYSKGLEERLRGFERFLRAHPEMIREVLYLQIAPSTRGEVAAYQELRNRVLALAGRINATWSDIDHAPMQCVNRNYSRAELAGIYRAARVGLVTPLRDGMNLVAKEYVAAQDPRDPGVLILSRFAGAAQQMSDALIVNPYARDEVADALWRAIGMSADERLRRWEGLMTGVARDDVGAWCDTFLAALEMARQSSAETDKPERTFLPSLRRSWRAATSGPSQPR
ncbi:MAG TPA: trehalose-6-phosphate synthase [Caulobacteraceae bacterium]|jgi:trehalose 6-phosphate synthase